MAIKFHTKKALVKRIKVLSKGKLKYWPNYTHHHAYNKSTKQKRHLQKSSLLSNSDWKRLKKMVNW